MSGETLRDGIQYNEYTIAVMTIRIRITVGTFLCTFFIKYK